MTLARSSSPTSESTPARLTSDRIARRGARGHYGTTDTVTSLVGGVKLQDKSAKTGRSLA